MISLVLAASIASQVSPDSPLIQAVARRIAALDKAVYVQSLENEATRVIADGTAADVLSGGADIAATGWGISNGAVEGNKLLGGSRNGALIIVGTKSTGLAATYFLRRRQMTAWKECMIRRYDGESVECNQRESVKRTTKLTTLARIGLAAWNAVVAVREDRR